MIRKPGQDRPVVDPTELREQVRRILPDVTALRRRLHTVPERAFEEKKTAGLLRAQLTGLELEVRTPMLGTDVVALLRGAAGPGPNVSLRADIDALPIEETSGVSWTSRHPGFCHACGHDGHAAMLIGAARVLHALRDRFAGSVRFVFQPAEEGLGGGKKMVEMGLLDEEPRPVAVYALHAWPSLPPGKMGTQPGMFMAASEEFSVYIKGCGGHGARPDEATDVVLTGAQVVQALQTVVSRSVDPLQPAVLSVCTFHSGTAYNVMPGKAVLSGTIRYFDSGVQALIHDRIETISAGVCRAAGVQCEVQYKPSYIALRNDPERTHFVERVVKQYLDENAWVSVRRSTGAEDFAFYLAKVPGVLLRLGVGDGRGPLHNSSFDFNDEALENGVMTLVALALETTTGSMQPDAI